MDRIFSFLLWPKREVCGPWKQGRKKHIFITCRTDRANEANKMFIIWFCWLKVIARELEVRTATYWPGIDQSQHAKSVSHIIKYNIVTREAGRSMWQLLNSCLGCVATLVTYFWHLRLLAFHSSGVAGPTSQFLNGTREFSEPVLYRMRGDLESCGGKKMYARALGLYIWTGQNKFFCAGQTKQMAEMPALPHFAGHLRIFTWSPALPHFTEMFSGILGGILKHWGVLGVANLNVR